MSTDDSETPAAGDTASKPGSKSGSKSGSWATVMNVEPRSVHNEAPPAVKNLHPALIGVFIGFFVAIVAMVVAIAVLKPPSS